MNRIALNGFVTKKSLLLTFFVLFSLIISENVFAIKYWTKEFVQLIWDAHKNTIDMAIGVYDYSNGPKSEHGYLRYCKLEASSNGMKYCTLMEISTQRQNKSNYTTVYFKNKLYRANIRFINNVLSPNAVLWADELSSNYRVVVRNLEKNAVVNLVWFLGDRFKDIRYIQISGEWCIDGIQTEYIENVVYDLKITDQFVLKSKTPIVNT